jgi:hypothetical protein
MRWGWRAATGAALAIVLASRVAGVPPPSVSLHELSSRVGEIVTFEGDVAAAYTTTGTCVLEFEAANPKGFRAVLVIPLFTGLPRQPERLYAGRRVRVSGRVQRFQGRLEMVLRDPSQVEIVDVAGAPPPPGDVATAPEPPPSAPAAPPVAAPLPPPPPAVVPPARAEREAPSTPPPPLAAVPPPAPAAEPAPATPPATTPPQSVVEAVERRLPLPDPCATARAAWREAAARAAEANAALGRCLAAETYRCRPEAMAMSPALARLEAAEQHVEDDCR